MKRIIQGREIDESQVDEWVAEAEAGYDVDTLRARWGRVPRGATAAQVIPVRLTEGELAALMARAKREGLNRSEAIRAALDGWSHVAPKKSSTR
ncbi:ribbon-helix-helix protein, CopG family [Leifsonia sp. Root112D2]|uniref:ribbon-helix-helix protein, CopG family n=1 Tax=Leifsonia sp. Root112D2 TaxID=1736426 RepID=UPI0006FDF749|nr:ribbon-helix-helix protein, CopG family [Leifsonia sp. Root112D2]KQV06628.1 CopG family transcriptional regulator [Leifsonia sp. Root112D2]